MKIESKRQLLAGMVILLALWPLAHRLLVDRYRLSPWRFFGWAMYCTPKLDADVDAYALENDKRTRVRLNRKNLDDAQDAARAFEKARKTWGLLVEPDEVAEELFKALPEAQVFELEVEHEYLDPDSACISSWKDVYRYERSQFDSVSN